MQYIAQAFDCLDEHEERFRRLDREDKRRAREFSRLQAERLDVRLDRERTSAVLRLRGHVQAAEWRGAATCAIELAGIDGKRDMIADVCAAAPG